MKVAFWKVTSIPISEKKNEPSEILIDHNEEAKL